MGCVSVNILRWFLLWLLLAVILAVATGRQCVAYYRLSRNGVPGRGRVLEKRPHILIRYSFQANDHSYEGIGRADNISPSFDAISIGDEILVNYLPYAPNVSCLGDPGELYSSEVISVSIVVLLFPTLFIGVLLFRYRKGLAPFSRVHVREA